LNVTETVRVWPGSSVTGNEGPENENWETDVETLEIVTLRIFSFVTAILWVVLVEPTDRLPKFTFEGLTLTFAYVTAPKASMIVMAAATV
jgi:hypothetical protein